MYDDNAPQTELIRKLDVSGYGWCSEAVLVYVKNGRGVLKSIIGKADEDYQYKASLLLNNKHLIYGEYPIFPTCSAMLARGYGIENADCIEIEQIRSRINSEYISIENSVEDLSPITGLLKSGYYVIADAPQYPTAGDEHFFVNVPDELTYRQSACAEYYSNKYLAVLGGYPAYIYPTQSNSCLNPDRANEYLTIIDKPCSPRAIALYNYGFISALLDGHHKAYAAARKGCMLKCLVIIPLTLTVHRRSRNGREFACFSDIKIPMSDLPLYCKDRNGRCKNILKPKITANKKIPENNFTLRYPTIKELAEYSLIDPERNGMTSEEAAEKWMREDMERLEDLIVYLARTMPEKAFGICQNIVKSENANADVLSVAFRLLLNDKTPETEQLFIDYIVENDPGSKCWDIVNSYWND